MASSSQAISFDEIIQADRKRRKNEQLASEIFGKARKHDATGNGPRRGQPTALPLASRISKTKRSISTASNGSTGRTAPPNPFQPPSRPSSAAARQNHASKIVSAMNDDSQAHVVSPLQPTKAPTGTGLSIKGSAGPFVVQASNFAPGTTAADIEAAVQSVATDASGSGGLVRCRVLTNSPTVIAEMVFQERYIADKVVRTFNNEKADGRILHVFLKQDDTMAGGKRAGNELSQTGAPTHQSHVQNDMSDPSAEAMDVEMTNEASYEVDREVANRDRQDREHRRVDPSIQDGRYGFNSRGQDSAPVSRADDSMRREERSTAPRRGGRADRGSYRDGYDESTGARSSFHHRDEYSNGYNRDRPPPYHGSGAETGRGRFRGDSRYGRVYSDDLTRRPPRDGRFDGRRGDYR